MRFWLLIFLLLPSIAFAQSPCVGPCAPLTILTVKSLATPGTQVPLTGTTSISNIAVVPVPAGLGNNGGVMLTCLWTVTSSTNAKTLAVIWSNTSGATTGFQLGTNIVANATTFVTGQTLHYGRNQNATNVQKAFPAVPTSPFGSSAAGATTGAVNTALPSFLNITGTLALGTESITVEGCQGMATISSP